MKDLGTIDLNLGKKERYASLMQQIIALVDGENNIIANLANISALLKSTNDFFWVGFYLMEDNELVLGPFQGPVACTRISIGKGVCGKSADLKQTILVPDVDQFPGHIACSANSKSELVVPVIRNNEVIMVIDIDSDQLDFFDENDQLFFEELANKIAAF